MFTRKRLSGAALAIAIGSSLAVASPLTATAATSSGSSYAEGQFLSGTLLGSDLANIVALASAEARNNGTQNTQVVKDPLSASVLQTVNLTVPGGLQLNFGSFLDAGAVSQFARADSNGSSLGASGAVGDDGGIGVGSVGSGTSGDLDLNLASLTGSQFASILADLKLSLEAVSAQATADFDDMDGDYVLDGANLTFTSPAIADLIKRVNAALVPVNNALASLEGSDGILAELLEGLLSAVNPVLGIIGSSADVSVDITTDINAAVSGLLGGTFGNGAVSFNLNTGTVQVNLEQLHGGSLNNLPVGTELLSDVIVSQILTGITGTVSALADDILSAVSVAVNNAQLDIDLHLDLLTDGGVEQVQVCSLVETILTDAEILERLLQGLTGPLFEQVCNIVDEVLPDLETSVDLDINGTLRQILNGTAPTSSLVISLLGGTVPVSLNINSLLDGLIGQITDVLFDADGAIGKVSALLQSGLVDPAVSGLLGSGTTIQSLLTDVLSVKVNLQDTTMIGASGMAVFPTGTQFTQTAVRVSVLGGSVSTINIAAATVGPNLVVDDPGCVIDCGPGDPDDPDNPDNPDNPGDPDTTATDRLATTGVGIATLVAVILALLAAGAYLAREGYRKNHPQPLS